MTTPGGPIDIELNLDSDGLVRGATQASTAMASLSGGLAAIAGQQSLVSRAWATITPSRALIYGLGAAATAAAATEQRLSKLAATESITGQKTEKLSKGMNEIARQFPIGNRGAEQLVKTLQGMGLTTEKSEKRVVNLGKVFAKTSIATGESADSIAQGMIKLNRAFGQFSPDPKKMEAMSDSLVTLSANSGASVTSITGFSNAISPFTRQLGIGATATMGIATAFSAMGEDGMAAGNAISKVMSDLNRSVRDGGEEINTYASMVGKTREEFLELAKTNPAQALSEILPAFAEGGGQGSRNLEAVGLDSARMQRPLLQVAQQGGFQPYIDQAMDSYGNGNAQKAAEASMSGFFDATGRAKDSAEQLAVAIGTPLLTPMNALAEAVAKVSGGLAAMAQSGFGQTAIKGFLVAIGLAAVALKALPVMMAVAMARGLASNTVFKGVASGFALGRDNYNPTRAGETRAGRFGSQYFAAERAGATQGPAARTIDRFTRPLFFAAQGVGENWNRMRQTYAQTQGNMMNARYDALRNAAQTTTNPQVRASAERQMANIGRAPDRSRNVFQRAWQGGAFAAGQVMEGMGRMNAEIIKQSSTPTMQRYNLFRPEGGYRGLWGRDGTQGAVRQSWEQSRAASQQAGDNGLKSFRSALGASAGTIAAWTGSVRASTTPLGALARGTQVLTWQFTSATKSVLGLAGAATKASASMLMQGMRSQGARNFAAGVASPAMLAITAAAVGFSRFRGVGQASDENEERVKNASMTSGLEDYREALNIATEATVSMAQKMKAAAADIAASSDTYAEARTVTNADKVAANQDDEVIRKYEGTTEQIAAQINALNVNGLQAQEMGAVKIDLVRQNFDDTQIEDILSRVREASSSPNEMQAGTSSSTDVRALAEGAAGVSEQRYGFTQLLDPSQITDPFGGPKGIEGIKQGFTDLYRGTLGNLESFQPGGQFNAAEVSEEQQNYIDAAVQGNQQRFAAQTEAYGQPFATQESFRNANEQYEAIAATGDKDAIARYSQDMSVALGASEARTITPEDVESAGSFIKALAETDNVKDTNKDFRGIYGSAKDQGVTLQGAGVERTMELSPVATSAYKAAANGMTDLEMESAGTKPSPLGLAFDNRLEGPNGTKGPGANPVANAVRESNAAPLDREKFRESVRAMADSLTEGGQSAAEAGGQLFRLGQTVSEVLPDFQRIQAVRQELSFQNQVNIPFQGQMQTFQNRFDQNSAIIDSDATTGTSDDERENARKDQAAALAEFANYAKQRLAAEFQYQTQRQRVVKDYNLQLEYQMADFNKNLERQQEDFQRNADRADRDFWRQRGRAEKQYELQTERAEADFYKGRLRAIRDFNKQMARAAEDGAKSFYDPYQRIQTQPSWSAEGLLMNFEEQLVAMEQQIENISRLRAAGLSQAAIDMLGLAEAQNAQQAARMVADLQDNPETATRLNETAQGRTAAAGNLNEQSVQTRRAREDLQTSLKDQEIDFRQSMDRSRADFNLSMAQSLEDYQRNVTNQKADHDRLIARAEADQRTALERQDTAFRTSLERMETDFVNSTKEILANETELAEATKKLLNGEVVEFDKLMVDSFKTAGGHMAEQIPIIKKQVEDAWGDGPNLPVNVPAGGPGASDGALPQVANPEQRAAASGGMGVINGTMTSGFGPRKPFRTANGEMSTSNHPGIDWKAPIGTPVMTPLAGTVTFAGKRGGYGNLMIVSHGQGRETRYGHLSGFSVGVGRKIEAGTIIARSGNTGNSTGPHLHFETRQGGSARNPASTLPVWRGQMSGGAFSGERQSGLGGPSEAEARFPTSVVAGAPSASGGATPALVAVGGPSVADATIAGAAQAIGGNYVTKADTNLVNTNNSRTYITYHSENHTYDQRTVVESATVVSQDPNDMARKLAAKQRLSALSARGRART